MSDNGARQKHLLVAVPTASGINVYLWEWLNSLLRRTDLRFTTNMVVGSPTMSNRNRVCLQALKSDADYIMSVDSDQVPYIDADRRDSGMDLLIEAIQRPEVDVVNILTVRRTAQGPCPVLQKITGPYESELYTSILKKPQGLHELTGGAVGGAGILMKRHVLERFWEEDTLWFKDVYQEKRKQRFDKETGIDLFGTRILGHDIWFFLKCQEFGFRSWIDTRVLWGHLKEIDMRDEFVRDMRFAQRAEGAERELGRVRRELARLKAAALEQGVSHGD